MALLLGSVLMLKRLLESKQPPLQKAAIIGAAALVVWKVYSKLKYLCNSEHTLPAGDVRLLPQPRALFSRYFRSDRTGLWVYRKRWTPLTAAKPLGVVFISHGYAEHSGRYDYVASVLTGQGFVVLCMDHQGHGQSEGDRGHVQAFSDYVDDFVQYVREEAKEYEGSGLPLFLLGHSMGGTVAALVASRTAEVWRGVVLSGPALIPDPKIATPMLKALARLLSSYLPKLQVTSLNSDLVSREPAVVQNYKADPLVYHGAMRVRWSHELLLAMDAALATAPSLTVPVLLLHGEKDGLTLQEGSRRFFDAVLIPDKTICVYPDMYHEIFQDPERDVVLADMLAWLKHRCDPA